MPQDGLYDINVAADPGANITLQIGGAAVPTSAMASGLWSNQGPISLTAGALVPITLTATSIKTTLSVSWQSQGMGWQPIPAQYLYPLNLVTRLGDTLRAVPQGLLAGRRSVAHRRRRSPTWVPRQASP